MGLRDWRQTEGLTGWWGFGRGCRLAARRLGAVVALGCCSSPVLQLQLRRCRRGQELGITAGCERLQLRLQPSAKPEPGTTAGGKRQQLKLRRLVRAVGGDCVGH